ncbi:dihydrofolate reductase [Planctomycetes bacterium K23_9]|uniref:Dihydrofolate reductase n=1 Tax=Stieleria marina TaxID=1930275 RepID=A0A517NQJ5_9BACT|nr:Dihydrofolate reductase type 3 [Planctomycetes bacterium K23_9]
MPCSSTLTAVVAMTPAGVIGLDGDMPWRLSSDLRRFKKLTMGGVLIMGRKTFDSIGRPLPGRRTVVISRNADWSCEGVQLAGGVEEAMGLVGSDAAFVVGGAQIYNLMLPLCGEVCLTRVWSNVVGDTTLSLNTSEFAKIESTRLPATARDDVPTEFIRLRRQNS